MSDDADTLNLGQRLRLRLLNAVGRQILHRFERSLPHARQTNRDTLRAILTANAACQFGRRYDFQTLAHSDHLTTDFSQSLSLTTYTDYEDAVAAIAAGTPGVLTTAPVIALSGTAGTTDRPKRIPTTRRSQTQAATLVGLAARAVLQRDIPGADDLRRGINLMSLYIPAGTGREMAVSAAPNSGMQRLRQQVPLLYTSPVEVFELDHPANTLWLHALFGLRARHALCIGTPFSPQVVSWVGLIRENADDFVKALRDGVLPEKLALPDRAKTEISKHLHADPQRAKEVENALQQESHGLIRRLWPKLQYINTVTSGSFALSHIRLQYLAGDSIPIHSPAYSASEAVIGLNRSAQGIDHYTLAVGATYFEFIPASKADDKNPDVLTLADVQIGSDYEIVVTTWGGLYRYRMGDVVQIVGFTGEAPIVKFLYRRNTILNLANEKLTEYHTQTALNYAFQDVLPVGAAILDYSVHGAMEDDSARYTFFVELVDGQSISALVLQRCTDRLDSALGDVNPYYRTNGRDLGRIKVPRLCPVKPGTFQTLAEMQLRASAGVGGAQVKTPRLINNSAHLQLLEYRTLLTVPQ